MAQEVKACIVQFRSRDAQGFGAELFPQRPLVEDKANVKGRWKRRFNLVDLCLPKSVANQCGVVDPTCIALRTMTDGVGDDFFDLRRAVAQFLQRRRDRAVNDFEITAPCQLFELHKGEVWLDAGCIAIHDQANGACRCNNGGLSVSVPVLITQLQRFIPRRFRQ